MERIDFSFFVKIEYERLPNFNNFCNGIGHSEVNCTRKNGAELHKNKGSGKIDLSKLDKVYVPIGDKLKFSVIQDIET